MPLTEELGAQVLERLGSQRPPREFTRGTFEEWLSRMAEDQPDLFEEENLLRRHHFSSIARWVAITIEDVERNATGSTSWLPRWVERFVGVAHAVRAAVVTFNYDTLVERAVDQYFLRDLKSASAIGLWSDALVRSCDITGHLPQSADEVEVGPHQTFRLLKLHGSTNFYWSPTDHSGATLVRWPMPEGEHQPDPLAGQRLTLGSRELGWDPALLANSVESPEQRRKRLLYGRQPLVVPPSALKSRFYDVPFLRGLWQQAREAILEASHLYLVGYSLAVTDLVALGLLREHLRPTCEVVVVNKGPAGDDVVERCRTHLFDKEDVALVRGPLAIEAWTEELVHHCALNACEDLAANIAAIAGGSGAATEESDRLALVKVYRTDCPDWEPLQPLRVDAQDYPLRLVARGPTSLAQLPRWNVSELMEFASRIAQTRKPMMIQYPDGGLGTIVASRAEAPQPRRTFEYSITCQAVRV